MHSIRPILHDFISRLIKKKVAIRNHFENLFQKDRNFFFSITFTKDKRKRKGKRYRNIEEKEGRRRRGRRIKNNFVVPKIKKGI